MEIASYVSGNWQPGKGKGQPLFHAVTGAELGAVSSEGVNFTEMLDYARRIGGPKLRAMTFHERALMLKGLAKYLMERKDDYYQISSATGATKGDSWIDIEGGIGTFFAFASKGRREFPNETFALDGDVEVLSKEGTFVGRHLCVPLEGVALHINAFNFPVWGMLEKLAPTFLAGMPAIVKPASATCYLAVAVAKDMIESGLLPVGALQIITGSIGDTFEHLTCQDVVTFTGSAETGRKLKSHPRVIEHSVRFNMEADSLNCSILGEDVASGSPEFDLFIKEVLREVTVKAGQKCTAIRRSIVPRALFDDVASALRKKFSETKVGNPSTEGVRMGPLASRSQVDEVKRVVELLKRENEVLFGGSDDFEVIGADSKRGAFFQPTLLACKDPMTRRSAHDLEPFGPVTTLMAYDTSAQAVELARLGKGSLVGSIVTGDPAIASRLTLGLAPFHGRILVLNQECAKESTGHGSPLPHLVHGGPGRAGGGEEMGGARGVYHYLQRTAVQGSPTMLTAIGREWIRGAKTTADKVHPFRKSFDELQIGDTLVTHRRTVTEADVVHFAALSGDHFYAHIDEIGAQESIFGKRVAHGYFVIAAAAGLFVDPGVGPVLANYGLERLRFTKPIAPGDTMQVQLTVKQKTAKEQREGEVPQGVVHWDVVVRNQLDELCATYTILTLVKRSV